MVHCLRLFDAKHTDHHILFLEAFIKPNVENPTRDLGAREFKALPHLLISSDNSYHTCMGQCL